MRYFTFAPGLPFHSKKALAGMIQRWYRSGFLKDGLLSMPSDRALIILDPTLGSLAHAGTSPHFMSDSTWSVCSAKTCWVGRTSTLSRIGGTLLVTRNRRKTRCPSTSSYLPHIPSSSSPSHLHPSCLPSPCSI